MRKKWECYFYLIFNGITERFEVASISQGQNSRPSVPQARNIPLDQNDHFSREAVTGLYSRYHHNTLSYPYMMAFGDGPRILNHGQVTSTTPDLAPPFLTTTLHQREDGSALDRFNVHRSPTGSVFSGTGLELVTS
ncbi:uncharacterized protein TNCV_957481 [Trichonephila clavipes]|nr:uncharacterized protein TNCV_957481 [Trichonephila clavipes]